MDEVVVDSKHFDMVAPSFPALDEVKEEVGSYRAAWGLYGEFTAELSPMVSEDWVAFRARFFQFEDLLKGWHRRLRARQKAGQRDMVSDYLVAQVTSYLEACPVLKRCTGELFEREHWKLLFVKLGMDTSITLATLTLGHFLERLEQLSQQSKAINDLAQRAQGEVTIREAVQELKVWSEEAEFSLTEHKSTKR